MRPTYHSLEDILALALAARLGLLALSGGGAILPFVRHVALRWEGGLERGSQHSGNFAVVVRCVVGESTWGGRNLSPR